METIEVLENKLLFSTDAITKLGIVPGDRISINYVQQSIGNTFPVIGKSEVFVGREAGNKLTKSNTVSFRGRQHDILLEYGSKFALAEYKPQIFILTKINN